MYTFTMVGCTLFKLCHCKCAKAYLLEILGMSRLWHDLMAHGHHLYLSINPQTHQSHKKESQHPNDTSDYTDKTKLTSKNSRKACVFRSVSVSKHVCF